MKNVNVSEDLAHILGDPIWKKNLFVEEIFYFIWTILRNIFSLYMDKVCTLQEYYFWKKLCLLFMDEVQLPQG